MSRLNWSGLDGAEFESLVHSLLFFEQPDTVLFARPGRDSGQDAISADGTHVYQAKYGSSLDMGKLISRTRKELDKVREYLRPDNKNYPLWSKVTHWTLVSNFEINPSDADRWKHEIAEKYSDLSLELDYWDATTLESLLTKYPDVEQAYFNGRNRSFIGLGEARSLLEKGLMGEYFFATGPYGWEEQFEKIDEFAESDHLRFLFVHGKAEIGKTRFLYESAKRLSEKGWRVFWGLPESMSLSNAWMTGITGANGKTCLLVDEPKSRTLVNAIYEQLSTVGKKSWKAIVTCPEHEFSHRVGENNLRGDTADIELGALSEDLVRRFVDEFAEQHDMLWPQHPAESLYELTKGVPGWISLILGLSYKNHKRLSLEPQLFPIINEQVQKAFGGWDVATRARRLEVLRRICAWKTVTIEDGAGAINPILAFLGGVLGIPPEQIRDDIKHLSAQGLLVCWGRNRRLYTAEPTLIRQHILSEWLLERDGKTYRPTAAGRAFVEQILKSEMPAKESALRNLSDLAATYLGNDQRTVFFKPVVDELKEAACKADTEQQCGLLKWADSIASVDPESALEIAQQLWNHPAPTKTVNTPYWGEQVFEHSRILGKIPWFLYSLAIRKPNNLVCRRVWKSFRRIFDEEKAGQFTAAAGQEPGELIQRLLKATTRNCFQEFAFEDLSNACREGPFSEYDLILAAGLLSCRRESVEAFGRKITFWHSFIAPGTPEWQRALDSRSLLFELLEHNKYPDFSGDIWSLLARAHHGWKSLEIRDRNDPQSLGPNYASIVLDDLRLARDILKNRSHDIRRKELEAAREMWEMALERGEIDGEQALAAECEAEYRKHSSWDLGAFFSWDLLDNALEKKVLEIKACFEKATDSRIIADFFQESEEFLRCKNHGQSYSDSGRSHDLAVACRDLYTPAGGNAFSRFIEESIRQPDGLNPFMDRFFVFFLRDWIRRFKNLNPGADVVTELKRLLDASQGKAFLLTGVYAGMSAGMLGPLSGRELSYICSEECKLDNRQQASILPSFLGVDKAMVLERLGQILDGTMGNHAELEQIWWLFADNSFLVMIRSENNGFSSPIEWLMASFNKYGINGNILLQRELKHLAKQAGFKMSQKEFVVLIKGRIALEKSDKIPSGFAVMPDEFDMAAWVSCEKDASAIETLCELSLEGSTYLTVYRLPEYIASMDVTGEVVEKFVSETLADKNEISPFVLERLGGLVSGYGEESDARKRIILPICRYMNSGEISRRDRYSVYQSFQPKLQIWASEADEIPPAIIQKELSTKKALDATPRNSELYEYHVWAHDLAVWELKNAQEEIEELQHE